VTPEAVAWLREAIGRRKALAEAAGGAPWEAEGDDPTDDEVYSASTEPDTFGEMVALTRGPYSHENTLHIAANDPRQVIADCETDLGILHLYILWTGHDPGAHPALGAAACVASDALRHVASAYRHQPGYAEHWGSGE